MSCAPFYKISRLSWKKIVLRFHNAQRDCALQNKKQTKNDSFNFYYVNSFVFLQHYFFAGFQTFEL